MLIEDLFRKELGEERFESLSKEWRDHIRRVDTLPKPRKQSSSSSDPNDLFRFETVEDIDRAIQYGILSGQKLVVVVPQTILQLGEYSQVVKYRLVWDKRKVSI
jgi:hypothetical protein